MEEKRNRKSKRKRDKTRQTKKQPYYLHGWVLFIDDVIQMMTS